MKLLISIFMIIVFCSSCGVKGPPLPPVKTSISEKDSESKPSTKEPQKKNKKLN